MGISISSISSLYAGTVGRTGTVSDEENASGQPAATRRSRKRMAGKRAG